MQENDIFKKLKFLCFIFKPIKGTVSIILCDPQGKQNTVRFTSVPLKYLSDQV